MQFSFSDEQEQFRAIIQRFLREKSPTTEVRRLMATERGYDSEVWRQLAEQLAAPDGTREIEVEAPLGALPMFARAGSILVTCEAAESAAAGFGEELTLHVFPDPDGHARGRLYEDAGEGFGYRDGAYRDAHLEAQGAEVEERVTGEWQSPATGRRIVVYGSETSS